MLQPDRTLKVILAAIAFFLGILVLRPLIDPAAKVMAQPPKFDHVQIVSPVFIYKGQTGLLLVDRRNANVWFLPRVNDQYPSAVFVIRLPFEKLDQAPQ